MNISSEDKLQLSEEETLLIESLILENEKEIKNIIYCKLGPVYRYLAEETLSELYLLMCKKADILITHPCPKAWIFVAAKHISEAMMKKNKDALKSTEYNDKNTPQAFAEDIDEQIIYKIWLENKIPDKLIATLSSRERKIYYMLYIEEKSVKDIAKELNITPNTVRNINKNLKDKIKYAVKRKNIQGFF